MMTPLPCPVQAPAEAGGPAPGVVDAPTALAAAEAGRAVFIDIRRPDEWQSTGMPAGTVGITLENADFVDQVAAAAGGDKSRAVILICRSGQRSARALALLQVEGFADVTHVGEGMIGSVHGPGWLARGLPLRTP